MKVAGYNDSYAYKNEEIRKHVESNEFREANKKSNLLFAISNALLYISGASALIGIIILSFTFTHSRYYAFFADFAVLGFVLTVITYKKAFDIVKGPILTKYSDEEIFEYFITRDIKDDESECVDNGTIGYIRKNVGVLYDIRLFDSIGTIIDLKFDLSKYRVKDFLKDGQEIDKVDVQDKKILCKIAKTSN